MATLRQLIHVARRVERHWEQWNADNPEYPTVEKIVVKCDDDDRRTVKTLLRRRGKVSHDFAHVRWRRAYNLDVYLSSERQRNIFGSQASHYTMTFTPHYLNTRNENNTVFRNDPISEIPQETQETPQIIWHSENDTIDNMLRFLHEESISRSQRLAEEAEREARIHRLNVERENARPRTMTEQMRGMFNRRGGGRW